MLVRRAAAYSIMLIVNQVQVLCCETAHGVYVPKGENTVITTHRAAAAAPAALCICVYVHKIDFSIALKTLQSSMIEHILTLEQKNVTKTKKNITCWTRTSEAKVKVTAAYLFAYLL